MECASVLSMTNSGIIYQWNKQRDNGGIESAPSTATV